VCNASQGQKLVRLACVQQRSTELQRMCCKYVVVSKTMDDEYWALEPRSIVE
jgi:hypothetical protein